MNWLVKDVPEELAEAEFGNQPSGAMAALAFGTVILMVCGGVVAYVALML